MLVRVDQLLLPMARAKSFADLALVQEGFQLEKESEKVMPKVPLLVTVNPKVLVLL
jgi:hypothetical protein